MNNKTVKQYRRIIRAVAKHTKKPVGSLTKADFEAFVTDRAMKDYAPQSLNLYRAAANTYLAAKSFGERLPMYSARQRFKLPERVLNRGEVSQLITALPPFYADIARRIYDGPTPPKTVLAGTPSALALSGRGGAVSAKTLHAHFRRVSVDWQRGPATPYALFVSGIIHSLQSGTHWRVVMESAGLRPSTMAKYYRLAFPHLHGRRLPD